MINLCRYGLAILSPLIFLGSFALSFGLTYLPCYSAICVEQHFPRNVRIDLISFYAVLSAFFLGYVLRVKFPLVRNALGTYLASRPLPFTNSYYVTWGGLLVAIGTIGFVAASQGYFWQDELDFYGNRALEEAGTTLGTTRLALVGSTGHVCDLLLGLIVLPISRNGFLYTLFELEPATLLRFHQLIGYLLAVATLVHLVPFFAWIPVFARAEGPLKNVFGIDNPTMSQSEVEENYYYASVLASGVISVIIFIAIIITSLPQSRRKSYNTFYCTHMLSVLFFVLVSIHASTDFYMLLPGLSLWLVDWIWRLRGLKTRVKGRLIKERNGWYRFAISSSDLSAALKRRLENQQEWPLKHFYLNVPAVSRWQNHPFTTASVIFNVRNEQSEIVWLFRVSNFKLGRPKQEKEWTVKLAALVGPNDTQATDVENSIFDDHIGSTESGGIQERVRTLPSQVIDARLEGPYSSRHKPLQSARSILCIVGGTGISGAISLARAFLVAKSSKDKGETSFGPCVAQSFRIVWSIRASEYAELLDLEDMKAEARRLGCAIDVQTHLTGDGHPRLYFSSAIRTWVETAMSRSGEKADTGQRECPRDWVYLSGPASFLQAGERACHELGKEASMRGLDWHSAKWDT